MAQPPKLPNPPAVDGKSPFGQSIAAISAVIGVFVTLNSFLVGCSNQAIEHTKAHREALQTEEAYWADLFTRFLNASAKSDTETAARKSELLTITYLSRREPRKFDEFGRGGLFGADLSAESEAVFKRRSQLELALRRFAGDNPDIGEDILQFLDDQSIARDREEMSGDENGGTPPPVTDEELELTQEIQRTQGQVALGPPVSTSPVRRGSPRQLVITIPDPKPGSSVLSTGSAKGWDIDVFWCVGTQSKLNYSDALQISSFLAGSAEGGQPIGPGNVLTLGRVRLRSLSESAQESGRFATGGRFVVHDRGEGEENAAFRLAERTNDEGLPELAVRPSVGAVTPWYLSVFVCRS